VKAFADGVFARPIVLCQGAVDDDHQRSAFAVGRSEVAAANHRNALRLEVISHHLRYPCQIQPSSLGWNVALGGEGALELHVSRGQHVGRTDGLHARQLLQPGRERQIESVDGRLGGILLPGQAIGGRQRVVGAEADADGAHLLEAA
jgi:hypothetical protein